MKTPTDPNTQLPKQNNLITQDLQKLNQNRTSSSLTNQQTTKQGSPSIQIPQTSQQNFAGQTQRASPFRNQTINQDASAANQPLTQNPTSLPTVSNQNLVSRPDQANSNLISSKTPSSTQIQNIQQIQTKSNQLPTQISLPQSKTSPHDQPSTFSEQNQPYTTKNKTSTVSVTSRNKNTNQPPTIAFSSTSNQPNLQTKGISADA